MRSLKAFFLATTLFASGAWAASDQVQMAPAPDWVKPVAVPEAPSTDEESPVQVLLADQQTRMEPGLVSSYINLAMRIQTPQGLGAGNLSFPWNPETGDLIVHKLVIHRGDEEIDVLGEGQTFTVVRREPNLESAMLDGVLTANIQPEGLQVGDVLEYAATMSNSDPVLQGHVEQAGGAWSGVPYVRTHLSVEWPNSVAMKIRQNGDLPAVKPVKQGNMTRFELSTENLEPVIPPSGAPARYAIGRIVEFSDFKDWAALGALLAPLYDETAVIPAEGPLRNELEKIRAASEDPVTRAEAALKLVQDRVRYVALLMGSGGLVPAKAEETWARRYGDCKAKSALLLALLGELGIEAEPVAANIILGDGIDERLPMVGLFNHVLVRAHIGGRDYWLDGTRTGDTSLARLRVPDFGWGLPLVAKNAALVRMLPEPLAEPDSDLAIEMDASKGLSLPAPFKARIVMRGDQALAARYGLANMTAAKRDKSLRDYWRNEFSFLEVEKVASAFDDATGTETLSVEGKATMEWKNGWYEAHRAFVGYEADFTRVDGPNKDAPFAVPYPLYTRAVETITLPPGYADWGVLSDDNVDETVAGMHYRRTVALDGDSVRIERNIRAVAPEFAASQAPEAQKTLRALADNRVHLRQPGNYRMTGGERETQLANSPEPKTVADYLDRARLLTEQERFDEAERDYMAALKLEPNSVPAKIGVGAFYLVRGRLEELAEVMKDVDVATVQLVQLALLKGLADQSRGETRSAIAAFDRALELQPTNAFVLKSRAAARHENSDDEGALADSAASLKIMPDQSDLYLLRANIFRGRGQMDETLAEAEAAEAANPKNNSELVTAARIYDALGKREKAIAAFDKALANKPEAYIYVNRAATRLKTDVDGRLLDYDEALKLDPDLSDAISGKANLLLETGDSQGAIDVYTRALALNPEDPNILVGRGIAYAKSNDMANAEADFSSARAKANDASTLNALCYAKATVGIALDSALSECEAALEKLPGSAPILDSKAFVLLRLGRFEDSIAVFDEVLSKVPNLAESLMGRAIAWSRQGNSQKAKADLEAALKIDPDVQGEFEGYGLTM